MAELPADLQRDLDNMTDMNELPDVLGAWVQRHFNARDLSLSEIKATRDDLNAIITEIEETGACRPSKDARE